MNRTVTSTITLTLNAEETKWLHDVMRNPLFGEHVSDEATVDAEMRLKFFEATDINSN